MIKGENHKESRFKNAGKDRIRRRLLALFLCFVILAGLVVVPVKAADEENFNEIVEVKTIELYYDKDGVKGDAIPSGSLLKKGEPVIIYFRFNMEKEKHIDQIELGKKYYINIPGHLVPPDFENSGKPLEVKEEAGGEGIVFGYLHADGQKAWVEFEEDEENPGQSVLAGLGIDELENAEVHLGCRRADDVPETGAHPVEGEENRYVLDFGIGDSIIIGYAEHEPTLKEAKLEKKGSREDQKINWTVTYTPWQNPDGSDGVTKDTLFEVRDVIDTSKHNYADGSASIDGVVIPESNIYDSREKIPEDAETYLLIENTEDGKQVLIFGGTKLNAGKSTESDPIDSVAITYSTKIKNELLLPGGGNGDKTVSNMVKLFGKTDGGNFEELPVKAEATVTVPTPEWITKEGATTRVSDDGAVTDWTVTINPNGFTFDESNELTLHDLFPDSSTLVKDSITVDGQTVEKETCPENDCSFVLRPIEITDGSKPVEIKYQTKIPENIFESGENLGTNKAWATFQYPDGTGAGQEYKTPVLDVGIGNGEAGGGSDTAILRKSVESYEKTERMISWQATINPHKINLTSGTFIDDLSEVGGVCEKGHEYGLKVMETSGAEGDSPHIQVELDGRPLSEAEKNLVTVSYDDEKQLITVEVGNVGKKTVTLRYDTLICDPCAFAANSKKGFTNTITAIAMAIGDKPVGNLPKADATQTVEAKVLAKGKPVYDYSTHRMKWTVEVNDTGLPMEDVVLTDVLPKGLSYKEGSLTMSAGISNPTVDTEETSEGEKLTIQLGDFTGKQTISFETEVNPEVLGFGGDNEKISVENTIGMDGIADGAAFDTVYSTSKEEFSNHGLIKTGKPNIGEEWIEYEVLINPFGSILPKDSVIVDTPTKELQLDKETVKLYKAELRGTSENQNQKPEYIKGAETGTIEVTEYNPQTNRFKVKLSNLPDDKGSYVLVYRTDMIAQNATGIYGNQVYFEGENEGGLGGEHDNHTSAGGGGGGGGGGVAKRKTTIAITKKDAENKKLLKGVTFTLYEWDDKAQKRGLAVSEGTTDENGEVVFKALTPGVSYVLEETKPLLGYGSVIKGENLPDGSEEMKDGALLITAGEKGKTLELLLLNEPDTVDLEFELKNEDGIPMAGEKVPLYTEDESGNPEADPVIEVTVGADGKVKIPGIRRGDTYHLKLPGGDTIIIEVPLDKNRSPMVNLPDGTTMPLEEYQAVGKTDPEKQWEAVLTKVSEEEKKPLAGAVFGLYADQDAGIKIKESSSGEDGTIKFSGLIKGQKYWVKELKAPNGYRLDASIQLLEEENAEVTISNKEEPKEEEPEEEKPGEEKPGDSEEPKEPEEPGKPHEPGSSSKPDNTEQPDHSDGRDEAERTDKPKDSKPKEQLESSETFKVAKTGDTNPAGGWLAVFLASGSMMLLCGLQKKKRKRRRIRVR